MGSRSIRPNIPCAGGAVSKAEKNLFQRNGIWYASFKFKRKRHRPSLRTTDRKEAREALKREKERVREEHRAATRFRDGGHTYDAAAVKFFREYAPGNLKPGTTKRYQVSLRQLGSKFEGKRLAEITTGMVGEYVSDRQAEGAKNATIRRDLTTLSRILATAQNAGWMENNPVHAFDRKFIKERRDPPRLPDEKQVRALVTKAPGNFAKLIDFLDASGMREEEAASLEWPDVEKGTRQWVVTLLRTKTSRPRVIILSARAKAILASIEECPDDDCQFVFWRKVGKDFDRYRKVSARFRQIADSIKLTEVTAHHLRHRFCVQWLRRGGDIYDLAKYVGHASVKTTEIYLRYLPQGGPQKVPQRERFGGATRTRGLPKGL